MSFRQFGGLNYSARHNIVASNYNTSNNLFVSQNVGQPSSYINFLSDISGTDIYTGLTGPTGLPGEIGPTGGSLWNQEGATNIYYIGNVSINTSTTSLDFLQILGNNSTSSSQPPDSGSYHNLNLVSSKTGSTQYSMALGVDCSTGVGYINAAGNSDIQPVCLQTRGGVVGIGTTSPNINISLDVSGQLHTSGLISASAGVTGATGSFTNISVSEQLAVPGGITGATGSFSYLNSSNNTYLATTAGKMVGIGTNTPETKLHIVDYSSNTILTLQAYPFVSDENALIGGIIFNNGGANSSIQSCVNLGGANNNSDLRFYTSLDYNNTNLERMRISRSGNVGIGTKTPLYTLDISGNLQTSKDSNINTITVGLGGGNISSNVALGNKPLVTNTTGSNNVAVGSQSLFKSLSGSNNVAVGSQALYNDISGYNNVAVGYQALYNDISGNNNVAVGYQALRAVVSGLNNVAVGYNALASTINSNNCAVGFQSLVNNTTGYNNCAFGVNSLLNNIVGFQNVAVGYTALFNHRSNNNTACGFQSGISDISGNNNTYLGFKTNIDNSNNVYTQSTALGANAIIDASNQIVLGTSTESIKIPGSYVGIGGNYNPTSGYALDVSGNGNFTGQVNISGTISWGNYVKGMGIPGAWLINASAPNVPMPTPVYTSCTNMYNLFNQTVTSGNISPNDGINGAGGVGYYFGYQYFQVVDYVVVYPSYGIIAWDNINWTGSTILNFNNKTSTPVCVEPVSANTMYSFKLFFLGVQI